MKATVLSIVEKPPLRREDVALGDIVYDTKLNCFYMRISAEQGRRELPKENPSSIFWVGLRTGIVGASLNTISDDILVKPINNGQIFEPK